MGLLLTGISPNDWPEPRWEAVQEHITENPEIDSGLACRTHTVIRKRSCPREETDITNRGLRRRKVYTSEMGVSKVLWQIIRYCQSIGVWIPFTITDLCDFLGSYKDSKSYKLNSRNAAMKRCLRDLVVAGFLVRINEEYLPTKQTVGLMNSVRYW